MEIMNTKVRIVSPVASARSLGPLRSHLSDRVGRLRPKTELWKTARCQHIYRKENFTYEWEEGCFLFGQGRLRLWQLDRCRSWLFLVISQACKKSFCLEGLAYPLFRDLSARTLSRKSAVLRGSENISHTPPLVLYAGLEALYSFQLVQIYNAPLYQAI